MKATTAAVFTFLLCVAYSASAEPALKIVRVVDLNEVQCLAENVYHEARGESIAGMLAVALVVKNRVENVRYPNTYCDVIKEGPVRESWKTRSKPFLDQSERIYYPVRHRCQFSWYCDGRSDTIRKTGNKLWERTYTIARAVIQGVVYDFTDGSTHYHADYVSPSWAKKYERVTSIEQHIFYRAKDVGK